MKFGFVATHRGIWPVAVMCGTLGVSRGAFYAWQDRPRSPRALDDERLGKRIQHSFIDSDRTYGARRVWFDVRALGFEMWPASHRAADAGAGPARQAAPAWAAQG